MLLPTLGAVAQQGDAPLANSLTESFWNEPAITQGYFVKVQKESRKSETFVTDLETLKTSLRGAGVEIRSLLAGPTNLYLRIGLSPGTNRQREAAIQAIKQLPLVAEVIADASANFAIKDIGKLSGFLHGRRG